MPEASKIKVLHLGRFDARTTRGGVQAYVETLISALGTRVSSDNLVSSADSENHVLPLKSGQLFAMATYGVVQSVPLTPGFPFKLRSLMRQNHYDIVHLNFPDPLALLTVGFGRKPYKVVITWHSDVLKQKWALGFYLPLLWLFLRHVDAVLVATPLHLSSCAQLKLLPKRVPIHVVPFGLESKEFQLNNQQRVEAEKIRMAYKGQQIVFALGRHVSYKGFEYLIEAFSKLENSVLLLGGFGPLTQRLLKQILDANLKDRVILLGELRSEWVPIYFHACDVFCLSSIEQTEAFGLVQLEAMMCEKPVVSCFLGNGVNFVSVDQETGLTVRPRDSQALAAALQTLADHPELASDYGRRGRARARSEFSLETMATGVLNTYISILPKSKNETGMS